MTRDWRLKFIKMLNVKCSLASKAGLDNLLFLSSKMLLPLNCKTTQLLFLQVFMMMIINE